MNVKLATTIFLLTVSVVTLGGCTSRAWYDGFKEGAKNNCRNQPESERERCLEKLNEKTYEEYEKERPS